MNIGFIVERNIYFRIFGPVIEEAIKKGHQVFCFHNYSQSRVGSKGYQFPDISQTPKFQNGEVVSLDYKTNEDIIEKCLQNNIRAIISLDFAERYLPIRNKLKEQRVFWFALQSGFDSLLSHLDFLEYPDRFFVFSHDGFWMADKSNIPDKNEIKKEWGIPQDKKVILLFPFPFGSSLKTFWTKCIYGTRFFSKENDYEVMKAIRKFCDNNNGFLIIKSRQKDPVKRYAFKMADKILYDEEFYPSTALKCFAVADIFFSFYSTGVMEAVAAGISHVCIAPDEKDWKDIQNPLFKAMSNNNELFDWPGVSYFKKISEIIKDLPQKTFNDFSLNKEQQSQYMQKLVNGKVDGVSEAIVLEIEKMIEKE